MYGLIFMILALTSLFFALYKLIDALKLMKKYASAKEKVLYLKLQNNSKMFITENLISDGFNKELAEEVVDEVFVTTSTNTN